MISRRKFERIILEPIDSLTAHLVIGAVKIDCPVVNISYRGLAVLLESKDKPKLGQLLTTTLDFNGQRAETDGEVKRLDENTVGIGFLAVSDSARILISQFLDPRYLGNQLREIPNKQLQDKHNMVFFGLNNTRLVVRKGQGRGGFENLQLIFASSYILIDRQGAVSAGRSPDGENFEFNKLEGSKSNELPLIDPQVIGEGLQLIRYAPLTPELRKNIEEKLLPYAL